jgi:hypothetical protein
MFQIPVANHTVPVKPYKQQNAAHYEGSADCFEI